MSDTYKHKNFGKVLRGLKSWIDIKYKAPRFFHSKNSKTSKYMTQTLPHRRRRAAERKVSTEITKHMSQFEFYDEGKHLNKKFNHI